MFVYGRALRREPVFAHVCELAFAEHRCSTLMKRLCDVYDESTCRARQACLALLGMHRLRSCVLTQLPRDVLAQLIVHQLWQWRCDPCAWKPSPARQRKRRARRTKTK